MNQIENKIKENENKIKEMQNKICKRNKAIEMELTMQRIYQLQRYIDYDRKQTDKLFNEAIEEYERQNDEKEFDDDGKCQCCGWMCEFEESHLLYSMNKGCKFIDEHYTCNYCDHIEGFLFRHKKTGEITEISL